MIINNTIEGFATYLKKWDRQIMKRENSRYKKSISIWCVKVISYWSECLFWSLPNTLLFFFTVFNCTVFQASLPSLKIDHLYKILFSFFLFPCEFLSSAVLQISCVVHKWLFFACKSSPWLQTCLFWASMQLSRACWELKLMVCLEKLFGVII